MPLDVTLVIPVFGQRDLLELLLASVRAQTHPVDRIVVVDNGSQDGADRAAEDAGAHVIRMGENTGFARAVNRGITECRTEWVAIVNTDVELAPGWLASLADAIKQTSASFATGKILRASDATIIDGTWDALCRGACALRAGSGRRDRPYFNDPRQIHSAPLTCALFRTDVLRRVGMLDERFGSYLEDVDLGLRCALCGIHGLYVPGARSTHRGSATFGRWDPRVVRGIARNQVLLVAKHYPASLVLRYLWPILVAQTLWGFVAARHGRLGAFLAGKIEGLRMAGLFRGDSKTSMPLREVLDQSERDIYAVQQLNGFDLYWRLYFFFTAGGAN